MKDIISKTKQEFDKILNFLKEDIASIRTGRANPAMVENVPIDVYGTKMTIKELASISAPEPRTLAITPWDNDNLVQIESGLRASNLGFNPIVDGKGIRINIPSLTEERRKEYVKLLHQKMEGGRVRIRQQREEAWKKIQHMEKESQIREDEKFKGKEELQKLVDEYNGKIDSLGKTKENELLT